MHHCQYLFSLSILSEVLYSFIFDLYLFHSYMAIAHLLFFQSFELSYDYYFSLLWSYLASKLNQQFATFMYSVFENLYRRVEINFGFISSAKDLTSSTASCKSLSLQPVNCCTLSVHPVVFLSQVADKIIDAAAM